MKIEEKTMIDKNMLINIEEFINNHYEFKCNSKYKGFFGKIKAYFDKLAIEENDRIKGAEHYYKPTIFYSDPVSDEIIKRDIEKALESSFSSILIKLINQKGISHIEIYKRANVDRKLFSKISNQKDYIPSKRTAIAFAVALELPFDETNKLLKLAGYTLSSSILFDVIVTYFIKKGIYDIFTINNTLFDYKQKLIGE